MRKARNGERNQLLIKLNSERRERENPDMYAFTEPPAVVAWYHDKQVSSDEDRYVDRPMILSPTFSLRNVPYSTTLKPHHCFHLRKPCLFV